MNAELSIGRTSARRLPDRALPWAATVWAAGLFTAMVALMMVIENARAKNADPWKSPQLLSLKTQLREAPKDDKIKARIRELDLEFRGRYFRQVARLETGAWLLLGGAAALVLAGIRLQREITPRFLPGPKPLLQQTAGDTRNARWSVAAVGATAGTGLFLVALLITNAIPGRREAALALLEEPKDAAAPALPAADQLATNWICFRGFQGAGFAPSAKPPANWDATNHTGIAWKTPVLAPGFNSPIVWQGKLFYSGGDAAKREILCVDAGTGSTLWRTDVTKVPGASDKPADIPESTGYAAPTMATDGQRAYAIFGNGDLAAVSFSGQVLWARALGPLENIYGHSISLVTWQDRLIVQLDQGEGEPPKSKLYALEGRTGRVIWEKPRKLPASWASPIVCEFQGKPQIVTLALPLATAYSAADGAELWSADCLNGEVTPSPVFAGGMVLVASPSDRLLAIRPDGTGNVTKTHVAWSIDENVPDVSSPASDGTIVVMLTTSGVLTCHDVASGRKLWMHDFEMDFHASPVIADGRIYLFSQTGTALVVAAAPEFKEVFRTRMPDEFHATPAVAGNSLYVRGMKDLWRLASAASN
jgi:outer membrane protein assembly factor BamB